MPGRSHLYERCGASTFSSSTASTASAGRCLSSPGWPRSSTGSASPEVGDRAVRYRLTGTADDAADARRLRRVRATSACLSRRFAFTTAAGSPRRIGFRRRFVSAGPANRHPQTISSDASDARVVEGRVGRIRPGRRRRDADVRVEAGNRLRAEHLDARGLVSVEPDGQVPDARSRDVARLPRLARRIRRRGVVPGGSAVDRLLRGHGGQSRRSGTGGSHARGRPSPPARGR